MPPYPRIWHSLSNKVCDGIGENKERNKRKGEAGRDLSK
jgi:hypothetical protein